MLARHGDVAQVVQAGKHADLAEVARPGEHGEANVSVGIRDHRIEITQPVANALRGLGTGQVVEEELVVFVRQHQSASAGGGVGLTDQLGKTGLDVGTEHVFCELDRRKAIDQAVRYASSGDVVLIAGKGHEKEQLIGNDRTPFDDCLVIRDCLDQPVTRSHLAMTSKSHN